MLTRLNLRSFKCFENLDLHLAPLTLLTGFNSAGKSTVIQSLGVLHQTVVDDEWSNELMLNGSIISLGTVGDVVNDTHGGRSFSIEVSTESSSCSWEMESRESRESAIPIKSLVWKDFNQDTGEWAITHWNAGKKKKTLAQLLPSKVANSISGKQFSSLLRGIEYISAERSGPREIYPSNNHPDDKSVGVHGEKAPWVLRQASDYQPILKGLIVNEKATLMGQVEAWLNIFFPGVRLEVLPVLRSNSVTLGLAMSDREGFRHPNNVGYGLTHILPIITACLNAVEGDIILIENPEAHLHPSGQSMMGTFLARAANAGIQVIVETHSDHVLNGIRLGVKGKLTSVKDVSLHFFMQEDGKAKVISRLLHLEN